MHAAAVAGIVEQHRRRSLAGKGAVNAARQAIDPGHHKGVPRLEEVEQDLEFGSAAASRAARLLCPDHVAAGSF